MIKVNYTNKEWTEREAYYLNALSNIQLPQDPTSSQLLLILSQLDKLYTEASFECSELRRKESTIDIDIKVQEAALFKSIKQQELTAGNKVTDNDAKSLVKAFLSTNVLAGYQRDVYTTLKATMNRLLFAEQLLKTLSEKKSIVMSAIGILKMEKDFSGTKDLGSEAS